MGGRARIIEPRSGRACPYRTHAGSAGRHTEDEVYVVLEGEATLEAEGERRRLEPGDAAFVAAGKEHHFVDYDRISVLVVFTRPV